MLRDERGGATLEVLIWLPLVAEMMLFAADVSVLYWGHGDMWTAARDTLRQTAGGEFNDANGAAQSSSVEAYAVSLLTDQHTASYGFDATNNRHEITITTKRSTMALTSSLLVPSSDISVYFTMASES